MISVKCLGIISMAKEPINPKRHARVHVFMWRSDCIFNSSIPSNYSDSMIPSFLSKWGRWKGFGIGTWENGSLPLACCLLSSSFASCFSKSFALALPLAFIINSSYSLPCFLGNPDTRIEEDQLAGCEYQVPP